MNTRNCRKQLAIDLTGRSICEVKVAAVISDKQGRIISWGWNSMGLDGYGLHAEAHAIARANRTRLRGALITIAGRRSNWVYSKPCAGCQALIDKWNLKVEFFDGREWRV